MEDMMEWTLLNVWVMVAVCIVLAVVHYNKEAIVMALVQQRVSKTVKEAKRTVLQIYSTDCWYMIQHRLLKEARRDGVVGMDCEWVQVAGGRRPVAMLQLATSSGLCVLVRLCYLIKRGGIPHSLREFLMDGSVLKAGVGTVNDSEYLYNDYGLEVQGCVDVRYLELYRRRLLGIGGSQNLGLGALSETFLSRTLDKDWRVRGSDWEAEILTQRQEKYAAEDALVGVQLLMVLMGELWGTRYGPEPCLLPLLLPALFWHSHFASAISMTCSNIQDLRFTTGTWEAAVSGGGAPKAAPRRPKEEYKITVRKGPLYHNCQLLAPDDQPLCTIDPKKAQWYVRKGLGHLVSEDPLVVRLNFEPTGRPQAERKDGEFYLQERLNVCVVCGQQDSYIRKSVIPHEYRRHFPPLLKHHQNHDVVLLCFPCHRQSNIRDAQLRNELSKEFQAPVANEPEAKGTIDKSLKVARDAARALLKHHNKLPEVKAQEYQHILEQFFGYSPTEEHMEEVANMEVKVYREGHQEHGKAVVEAYKKVGLSKLEQRWRQHFLDVMHPQFLPECWSVTHNMYKMQLKMARLPLDHPDRLIYKMALVGTEGSIDVPYNPREGKGSSKHPLLNTTGLPVTEKGNTIVITSPNTNSAPDQNNLENKTGMLNDIVNNKEEHPSDIKENWLDKRSEDGSESDDVEGTGVCNVLEQVEYSDRERLIVEDDQTALPDS